MAVPTEQQAQFRERVAGLKDFNEAFELVKSVVMKKFRMHRAGLSLILQMMPSNLGAYHMLGSNAIVINSYLLAAVRKIAGSNEEYNSYLFMVLAHEYLHSLGIVDENTVRQMTFELCNWMLGDDHTATRMAKEDPSTIYPELRSMMQSQFSRDFQVVRNFDKTNQTYIQ
ncbi:MAG TPA: hypothetical protein VFS46_01830 [Nitrososphaera sp.]|nr:hypothetical protein [Nitrososphaera sp.]